MVFLYPAHIRPQNSNAGGFTLVETVSVLVLLSILAIVALVRIPALDQHTRVIEINTLKSHLRYAQSRAMATEKVWGIEFNPPSGYRLFSFESPNYSYFTMPGTDTQTVNLMGLKLATTIGDNNNRIHFNWLGTPIKEDDSAWNTDLQIFEAGSGATLFTVSAETGFIE